MYVQLGQDTLKFTYPKRASNHMVIQGLKEH